MNDATLLMKAYWDEDPDPDRNQIIDLDKIEVRQIVLDNVATTWRDEIREQFVLVRMINGIVVTVNWFHHQEMM